MTCQVSYIWLSGGVWTWTQVMWLWKPISSSSPTFWFLPLALLLEGLGSFKPIEPLWPVLTQKALSQCHPLLCPPYTWPSWSLSNERSSDCLLLVLYPWGMLPTGREAPELLLSWLPIYIRSDPGRKQMVHSNWVIWGELKGLFTKVWAGCRETTELVQ